MITSGKLANISEEGHDKDIGGQNVVEEAGTKVFPSLYRIRSFLNGIVELRVNRARSKLEAKIFAVCFDGKG